MKKKKGPLLRKKGPLKGQEKLVRENSKGRQKKKDHCEKGGKGGFHHSETMLTASDTGKIF